MTNQPVTYQPAVYAAQPRLDQAEPGTRVASRTAGFVMSVLFALGGLMGWLFVIVSSAGVSGVSGAVSLVLGPAFGALLLWLISRSAVWPRITGQRGATAGWVACAMLAGGGTAAGLVVFPSTALLNFTYGQGWDNAAMGWAGGYPEEIAKAMITATVLLGWRQCTRPWHGIAVGFVVGTGFEVMENVMYAAMGALLHPTSDFWGALETWGLRIFAGPGIHAVYAGLAGWGVGVLLFGTGTLVRRLAAAAGWLCLAIALHFSWNYIVDNEALLVAKMIATAVAMYAVFFWLLRRASAAARAEGPTVSLPWPGAKTPQP